MNDKKKEILVLAYQAPQPYTRGEKGLRESSARLVKLNVDVLKENLREFIESMNQILADIPKLAEPYKVDEVEVSFEITAEGSIQLIGGVKAGATGGFTLKMKR
jgi:hypothetical protein